uniref:Uncharacterized protein n=1 Tax=viral metagenome TaxID=1070528 RepID=A0A6C0FAV3_9ZZZZ
MNNGMDSDGHVVSLIELLDGSKRLKRSFCEKYCSWYHFFCSCFENDNFVSIL